jgi:hypothetical protein
MTTALLGRSRCPHCQAWRLRIVDRHPGRVIHHTCTDGTAMTAVLVPAISRPDAVRVEWTAQGVLR